VSWRTLLLAGLAMLAFAGNSLLCRLALKTSELDPASFTGLRLGAGALMLLVLLGGRRPTGNPLSALSLFAYAAAFSFAYLSLDTGTGALLLFGAVQLGMTLAGLLRGERLRPLQTLGFLLAVGGLLVLLLPGASAPAPMGTALMLLSGLAWALYSLRGRGAGDPLAATAGNFLWTLPLALLLTLLYWPELRWDSLAAFYAVLSGALASGVGYALWYAALRELGTLQAASLQLSVPVLAALAGLLVLDEAPSLRLLLVSIAVLGGIALVLRGRRPA
jgi:drug/metabolite transporter (DMT)-like permease